MWLPGMFRIAGSESLRRSAPSKRICPAILPGGCGTSRRMEFAVTDLPQPLSPTIATVSPRSTAKDTPSTARLTPSGVRKWVWRFSTSSRAMTLPHGLDTFTPIGVRQAGPSGPLRSLRWQRYKAGAHNLTFHDVDRGIQYHLVAVLHALAHFDRRSEIAHQRHLADVHEALFHHRNVKSAAVEADRLPRQDQCRSLARNPPLH